jgi:hypothetical protein
MTLGMTITTLINADFGARVTMDDLDAVLRDADAMSELQQLLDRQFVVVLAPAREMTKISFGDAATARRAPLVIAHPRTREPLLYLPKNPASTIAGLPDDEGRRVLQELWDFVSRDAPRFESRIQHNQLVIWDGLGTVHTNPSYPRDRDRTVWFLVVPGKSRAVEGYFGSDRLDDVREARQLS